MTANSDIKTGVIAPAGYEGYTDTISEFEIYGWAIDRDSDEKLSVDLVIDNQIVATCRADIYREDLKDAGISNGHAAFHFAPYYFLSKKKCDVCVRYSGTDTLVQNSRVILRQSSYNFEIFKPDYHLKLRTVIESNKQINLSDISEKSCIGMLDDDIPDEIYIGEGLAYYVSGWVFNLSIPITKVDFSIDDKCFSLEHINFPRDDVHTYFSETLKLKGDKKNIYYSGFSGIVELMPGLSGMSKKIRINAVFKNGTEYLIFEKEVHFPVQMDDLIPAEAEYHDNASQPLIAICMAVYAPKEKPFIRQIESIKKQSHTDWICIISDDGSDEQTLREINNAILDDKRFCLIHQQREKGFYHNFEYALRHVPENVEYVAFADQDDCWYPDKLERLVKKIESDNAITLVYSDMKIVSESGEIISETYWKNRKNYYKDISLVMAANTVTGAATLFRRSLLSKALPFPQNIGNSFHDHVIACTALTTGKIAYINDPLYDYIQYDTSFIGHCDFQVAQVNLLWSLIKKIHDFSYLRQVFNYFIEVYNADYLRLKLLSRTLELRTGERISSLFNDRVMSMMKLITLHLKVKLLGQTTNDAELKLALAYLSRKISKLFS